jgi:hypothetical protein
MTCPRRSGLGSVPVCLAGNKLRAPCGKARAKISLLVYQKSLRPRFVRQDRNRPRFNGRLRRSLQGRRFGVPSSVAVSDASLRILQMGRHTERSAAIPPDAIVKSRRSPRLTTRGLIERVRWRLLLDFEQWERSDVAALMKPAGEDMLHKWPVSKLLSSCIR